MNQPTGDLQRIFEEHQGRCTVKWRHYLEIYDRHFSRFRGTDVHLVEIGVADGGSLQIWRRYFGEQAHICGIDINPHCKELEDERTQILIGDQSDKTFLQSLKTALPRIDILIDDGGHFFDQQINTFEILFPHLSERGVYLCEDLHTSYWHKEFRGGLRKRGTFIEYSKNLIDALNAWHYQSEVSEFTRTAHSLHYYDSMLVIEKRPLEAPAPCSAGSEALPDFHHVVPTSLFKRIRRKFRQTF
jgi:23S rRNA U2552 (ribose-2'-O)-methylase RlmE/FtsJ